VQECVASAENVYPCYTQLQGLHNIQQGEEESISDYSKRVQVQWEFLTTSAPILYERINPKLQEGYQNKSPTERVILNRNTDEAFAAYIMVIGADHVRFGGMIERFEQAYSVGCNNYPQTLNNAKNGPMTAKRN
jgi:hypothetical protein